MPSSISSTEGGLGERITWFWAERLSDYKVPGRIVFLGDPLPRNANGKVLKPELRKLVEAELTTSRR
jgi:acyl-CoA synthetase (AMP-forming)/AMP-acid ligase II